MRVFCFLILMFFCISCNKFSGFKPQENIVLDTVINFTSVDFSPSFKECDSLIQKLKKSDCFRQTIHQKIGAELQKYPLTIRDSINEVVYVDVLINAKGKIILQEITSSKNIQQQLSNLDSLLKISIQKLPTISPAVKRGIPVTTKYRLPIKFSVKD